MKKCVIFCKHAIAKTLINQVVIDIEGCDKHEIEAFVKSFNLICLKTNFLTFSISRWFKIFLKFQFLKTYLFKILKKSPKLFIILASHMESFILGSKWDLIFHLCFVSQTIQNIFEIWIFKKPTFLKFWKNHQNCSLSWSYIWKVSFWDLNVENLVHWTWNDLYVLYYPNHNP
jgi:hypothetical protein